MIEDDRPLRISDTKPVRRLRAMIEGGWIEEALLAVEDEGEREELAREFHSDDLSGRRGQSGPAHVFSAPAGQTQP